MKLIHDEAPWRVKNTSNSLDDIDVYRIVDASGNRIADVDRRRVNCLGNVALVLHSSEILDLLQQKLPEDEDVQKLFARIKSSSHGRWNT